MTSRSRDPASGVGRVSASPLPVGVRALPDGSWMLLIPLRLPEPAFEALDVQQVRALVAGLASVGARLNPPLRLLESPGGRSSGGGGTPGALQLREQFVSAFGAGLLPLPESPESSRFFQALQMSARFMGEGFREAAIELFTSPAFIFSVYLSVLLYFSAWLAPEPLFTKAFAATLTLRLSLLVGLVELARVARACLLLYQESEAARSPRQLEAASERFGKALGGTGLRVVVAVASMGLGRLLPGPPEGGLQLVQQARRLSDAGGGSAAVIAQSMDAVAEARIVAAGVVVVEGANAMASAGGARLSTRYGPPHTRANPPHNEAIEEDLSAREAAGHKDLLKNKAQVDATRERVFYEKQRFRRPDASSVRPDGVRHNINYVSNARDMQRELEAFESLKDADPKAIHELYSLDGTLIRRYIPLGVGFP